MISKELCDEKAVRIAINRIKDGEYTILGDGVTAPADEEIAEIADAATRENVFSPLAFLIRRSAR